MYASVESSTKMSSRYGLPQRDRDRDPYSKTQSTYSNSLNSSYPRSHSPYTSSPHYQQQRNDLFRTSAGAVGGGGAGVAAGGADRYSNGSGNSQIQSQYRVATPNRKGQYSSTVMDELESQNDEVEGLRRKVGLLKEITVAIGEEVRSSTSLMESINEGFEGTRRKLQRTMADMLRMAGRTGVGWRVWIAFFAAVFFVFWWVWI